MKKLISLRKDTHPGYHPTTQSSTGVGPRPTMNVKPHNCTVCRHPDREEIERKYADGWRLCDILRAHPWMKSESPLVAHLEITGLKDALAIKRNINSEEILERIVRAGLPVLEEGKVYPRDIIDAIKALNELKNKDRTDSLWELIYLRKKEHGSPSIATEASYA